MGTPENTMLRGLFPLKSTNVLRATNQHHKTNTRRNGHITKNLKTNPLKRRRRFPTWFARIVVGFVLCVVSMCFVVVADVDCCF
jgi:hypothetical protein